MVKEEIKVGDLVEYSKCYPHYPSPAPDEMPVIGKTYRVKDIKQSDLASSWVKVESMAGDVFQWLPADEFIKFSYTLHPTVPIKRMDDIIGDCGMDYEFNTSSPDALDEVEIEKELSKEHPVCIVHDTKRRLHKILSHSSIHTKVEYVDKDIYTNYLDTNPCTWDSWYKTGTDASGYNRITTVMNIIREIRHASYSNKAETTFKVVFPKI